MSSDERAESIIREQLEDDKSVQWAGRPVSVWKLSGCDGCISLFSLINTAALLPLQYLILTLEVSWPFKLILTPWIILGIYLSIGRYFQQAFRLKNTIYGPTNERAIIVQGFGRQVVRSAMLDELDDIEVEEYKSGTGTIYLGNSDDSIYEAWGKQMNRSVMPWMNKALPAKFERIANVRNVAALIQPAS